MTVTKELPKLSFERKGAKAWTAGGATNRPNGSSVCSLQASSVQVATLQWDQTANSTNEMIAFCEAHSTPVLEDRLIVVVRDPWSAVGMDEVGC